MRNTIEMMARTAIASANDVKTLDIPIERNFLRMHTAAREGQRHAK